MSNDALSLLEIIKNEYQERLKNDIPSSKAIVFNLESIIDKYNLNYDITHELLDELNSNGYIEKWITGDFEYKVD